MGTFYSNNDYRNYLAHFGVKGMKWGVRKERAKRSRYRNRRGQLNRRGRKEQAIYSRAANSANKKADEWDAIYADSVKSHKQWLRRLHENGDRVARDLAETYKAQGFYKGREHEAARENIKWHTREDLKDIRLADKARNQWRTRARYYTETPVENFSSKEREEAIQLGNSRR